MKAPLRLTLKIILVVFAFFFLIPLFLPSAYTITADKEINAPDSVVFNLVNNLRNRKKWSPFMQDATLKNTFSGPEEGSGAKRSWKSKKSGTGSIEIVQSVPNKSIKTNMSFGTPGTATGYWSFAPAERGTKVTWKLHFSGLRYPFGKWLGLFLRKSIHQILETGLDELQYVSEEEANHRKQKQSTP